MQQFWKTTRKVAWRLIVLVVGMALLLAGIVMIVTPGPAIVFIPAGLALLATEFQWARWILNRVRPFIDAAIERARQVKDTNLRGQSRRDATSNTVAAKTDDREGAYS